MRDYELVLLLHPDLEIDLEKPLKKIEKLISDIQGTIVKRDSWGKRKLAYRIKKQDFAVYVYYDLQLKPDSLTNLEHELNINEEVLRHLLSVHIEPPVSEEPKEEAEVEEEPKDEKEVPEKEKVVKKTRATKVKEEV